jgi:hypothetical protein
LFEELGAEYDVKIFHRDSDMRAPPELEKIHPLGKSPLVTIATPDPADPSQQKQLVLAESGFIFQYMTEHFGRTTSLAPKRYLDGLEGQLGAETDEWMRYQYFLHYAEGSLQPPILVGLILSSKSKFVTSVKAVSLTGMSLCSSARPQDPLLHPPHHVDRRRKDVCFLRRARTVQAHGVPRVPAGIVSRKRGVSLWRAPDGGRHPPQLSPAARAQALRWT